MYLRTVKAKGADGVEFEYIRLVEAYWENGHSKQRVVANLGRKDVLAPHLESLIELLGGGKKTKANSVSRGEHIEATVAACWGPMLVARSLWREFGLESILDSLAPKTKTVQRSQDWLWRIECWCWWLIGFAVRAVSTRWRNGWRAILSVDVMERGFWLAGNSRVGYGWTSAGSRSGIARLISC